VIFLIIPVFRFRIEKIPGEPVAPGKEVQREIEINGREIIGLIVGELVDSWPKGGTDR